MRALEVTYDTLYKGADYEQDFQLYDENSNVLNLTGCQVISKIKKYPGSQTFNTFDIDYVNRSQGLIRLLMSHSSTIFLQEGRNYFDVMVVFPNNKIKTVIKGTIIVEATATSLITPGQRIGDLGKVDTENISDGEVLMYNQDQQKLEFVNSDEVLEKAAENGLPNTFVDEVKDEIENKFELDFGEY